MRSDDLATLVTDAVKARSMNSARTQQTLEGRLGASEIGMCRSYLWRFLRQDERAAETDIPWKAFIGTWLGEGLETAVAEHSPRAHVQHNVLTTLPSGRAIPGHVDLWLEPEGDDPGAVVDFKSVDGNLLKEQGEVDRAHAYQIALYHLGLVQQEGLPPEAPAYIVYVDRSGTNPNPVVREVPTGADITQEIDSWVEDAIYGLLHDEEPSRDRPYEWCQVACPFFADCRGQQQETGLITEPVFVQAAEAYLTASAQIKAAESLRDEAKRTLAGVSGSTGRATVSWTLIGESQVSYSRKPYQRLTVRGVK